MQNNDPDDPASSGEFTRLFRSLEPAEPKAPVAPPKPPEPAPVPDQAATRPMTRIFTAKAQPQRPEHASNPPAFEAKPGPGEFTRMFSVPPARTEAPARREPPATRPVTPPAKETSFTELFNVPQFPAGEKEVNWKDVESKPAPLPAKKEPGEFTQMFERKTPGPAAIPADALGGIAAANTGMFPKAPVRPFEASVTVDEFAKVIGGQRARVEAAAPVAPAAGASVPGSDAVKKAPSLMVVLIVIAVVVILAAGSIYFFVVRG